MTKELFVPSALVLVLVLGVYGCNSPDNSNTATPAVPAEEQHDDHDHGTHDQGDHDHADHDKDDHDEGDHDHADHDHADHDKDDHDHADHDKGAQKTDMEKMTESLAGFSPEDRESAMKQHVCPVSGEMLGTMGAPKKVDVNGQPVWICCDGCKDKMLADPEKYLAKLAK